MEFFEDPGRWAIAMSLPAASITAVWIPSRPIRGILSRCALSVMAVILDSLGMQASIARLCAGIHGGYVTISMRLPGIDSNPAEGRLGQQKLPSTRSRTGGAGLVYPRLECLGGARTR